jgi:hypothetical protein
MESARNVELRREFDGASSASKGSYGKRSENMKQQSVWFVMSVCVLACGRGTEADSAEDADESASVASTESALVAELSGDVAAAPDQLAAQVSARVGNRFQPKGCVTSTQDQATVTYVFVDCRGPFGLVRVTGTVTAVYSRASNGGVNIVVSSKGLKANRSTLDLKSTVVVNHSAQGKVAQVDVDAQGTGPRGNLVLRKGSYTLSYDATAECVALDGAWQTTTTRAAASTTVSGYKRCRGSCPAAGGSIVHTSARGETVTLTYDGSPMAQWASSERGGRSGTVTLTCGSDDS